MSECSCVSTAAGDYGYLQCFTELTPKARKQHKCYECERIINKGEIYTRCSGIGDDGWSTYKICPDCKSLINTYFCGEFVFGEVWEDFRYYVRECHDHLKIDLNKLTSVARKKVCDLVEEYSKD